MSTDRITREQGHRLVEAFVHPRLQPDRHMAVDAVFDAEEKARKARMPHWFDVLTPAERDECLDNIRHAVKAIAHGEAFGCLEEVLDLWRLVAAKTTLLTEEE